jgi:hypothetical protein
MLARKGKEEKKGKEGPCENPYKEWIFVSERHGHPLVLITTSIIIPLKVCFKVERFKD